MERSGEGIRRPRQGREFAASLAIGNVPKRYRINRPTPPFVVLSNHSREQLALRAALISEGQEALYNRAQASEHYKQFKQVRQAAVWSKPVDGPKTDCPHDNDDQNANQD